ncbi:uncharacterized protein LOC117219540 [Megalopta genalis]|uniref:uncharacterized protein LOC117219540 n=1 Tax=Megalopta genalis TaxID=115081 RepID=UPI0014435523|nr:uncharacterized protein LOC117219540 [Megalopta genalis]
MSNENIERTVLALYGQGRWEDIANLECSSNEFEKCRLFWVLPTVNDLRWIKELMEKNHVVGLTSVGCGTGLFEWLFETYSGLEVAGIELDRSWWCSKYSPPLFLSNVSLVRGGNTKDIRVPENHAILFCYFNNGPAFCEYVENYKGKLIFVIGPEENQHRWTDPMPFDEKFHEFGWQLLGDKKIERTDDYITVYGRR